MTEIDAAQRHTPVLLERCLDLLAPALQEPDSVMVDGTLGMGGHTEAVLRRCPQARVIGIDRDEQALSIATKRLAGFPGRFTPVHATYDDIGSVVAQHVGRPVQAVLLDLGVSSLQLDEDERGFSYSRHAPLDMRMDPSTGATAADLLADLDHRGLTRILRDYGEERFAPRIASALVRTRTDVPITTSTQLAEIVASAIPRAKQTGGHPAKRTFQALRIAVNRELDILTDAIPAAIEVLAVAGRLVVESYHSLEDRIVKRALVRGATSSAPRDWPVEPESHRPYLELLIRGAEKADEAERETNPRSASVRLRAAVRTRPTPEHMVPEATGQHDSDSSHYSTRTRGSKTRRKP